ncbi:NYN domain-containing protein [Anabaena sp. PCC 7108]|uniref:NYN domain-containing protein n=1 Tax=Anabaena sp. PCC 7108 TaxID=163908 RepID=UPI00036811E2|nr:NYN domain-containing protein [Anabaena sp. PCC 7108]
MSKLHIFIDGTWLFKVCSPDAALASATDRPTYTFSIDWHKFDAAIKQHIEQQSGHNLDLGERVLATSIFTLPGNFDDWSNLFPAITSNRVNKTKRVVYAKDRFVQAALDAGYSDIAIFRPEIKDWIIPKLEDRSYQEKQVDTTVVALLVKSAITQPDDYHAVVTGDADMIPAIKTAYPEYTENILIVSTHPDELNALHRQSSFSYFDFKFDLEPFYLKQNADKIIAGNNTYKCVECSKVFTTNNKVPSNKQPRCSTHRA